MKKTGLDRTDLRILSAIQEHGRVSKSRLAELVNLSPTPCWARLERLKAGGYIKGFHADLALNKICNFAEVIVTVALTQHRKIDFDRFEAEINKRPEITECVSTGGGMDYVMKVVSPNLEAFQNMMDSLLALEIGIEKYMTYIVTRRVKSQRPDVIHLATYDQF
jgi:Lrp/AsnC family transcriptional regulator of ectoine degradation